MASGRFRPTRSVVSVVSSMQTTVSLSSDSYGDIPRYKFDVLQMEQIIQRAKEDNSDQTFAMGEIIVDLNFGNLENPF